MLVSFSFENYKSFAEGKIELKPITILLGPNSSGKTSLVQILLLMQQTLSAASQKFKSALKLHGKYVSLGESKNLFKDKKVDKLLSFSFEFSSQNLFSLIKETLWFQFLENLHTTYRYLYRTYITISEEKKLPKSLNKAKIPALIKISSQSDLEDETIIRNLIYNISELNNIMKGLEIPDETYYTEMVYDKGRRLRRRKGILSVKNFECIYELLKNIRNIETNIFQIEYIFNYNISDNQLYVHKIIFKNRFKRILEMLFEKNGDKIKLIDIDSDLVDKSFLNNYNATIQKCIDTERSLFYIFKEFNKSISSNHFSEIIRNILFNATEELSSNFKDAKLHHISPLRAEPKRFYFLDMANIDAIAGDNLVEVLKENDELLEKVNSWLNIFNVEIKITEFKEIIHRLTVTQGGLDFDLDITDVGFGISQILPVIVQGFLSKNDSLTIIEQPEIHLHPKMQAELADLFIDITKRKRKENDYRKLLIIETHSEYLLKRLRRRISEGKINAEDVAIYFIELRTDKDDSKIERIKVHNNGDFKWPKAFYIDDLEDVLQFLKNK